MSENANFSKRDRRMLGLSLHGWENIMVASLIIAAILAAFVGVSTWAVVKLQRQEIANSKDELERYKLDAGQRISAANAAGEAAKAAAAEANKKAEAERLERLKLEAQFAWRRIDDARQAEMISELSKNPQSVFVV